MLRESVNEEPRIIKVYRGRDAMPLEAAAAKSAEPSVSVDEAHSNVANKTTMNKEKSKTKQPAKSMKLWSSAATNLFHLTKK